MIRLFVVIFCVSSSQVFGQLTDSIRELLSIDTSFAYLQYDNPDLAASLSRQLSQTSRDKFVIFHYGGSHIQAGMPPKVARGYLQSKYGDGGNGMMFSYDAANTYGSVLYTSKHTGSWTYAKSFMGSLKVPLGVAGMSVETADTNASLLFQIKEPWKKRPYLIRVFTEADSSNYAFQLRVNGFAYPQILFQYVGGGVFELEVNAEIRDLVLSFTKSDSAQTRFRFYGVDVESAVNSGLVYHSLGVGAAAMRSVLRLEKLPAQAALLKPDLVILDFGTNDILYTNSIDGSLAAQVEKAIAQFRGINPNILVVLTSTQDLYRKKRYISAGVDFVNLMDSLARKNDCFFWNWYDLSGGYGKITTWTRHGFAKSDHIHLTPAGYEIKGQQLFRSIENTLSFYRRNPDQALTITPKGFPEKIGNTELVPPVRQNTRSKVHTVRSGDTLSQIAAKYHVSVSRLKSANGLKSDRINIGQRLKIPN